MIRRYRYLVFLDVIWMMPVRIKRLVQHFLPSRWKHIIYPRQTNFRDWVRDFLMLVLDLSGFPDVLMQIRLLIFPGIRSLTENEKSLIKRIYGNSLDPETIWMDSINRVGTKKFAYAYVLHHSINYYQDIQDDVLIHEAMHILQYQCLGSVYISHALMAQWSKEGYDYNGGQGLYNSMMMGKRFWDFNFEQQGQIVQDYYRILIGKRNVSPIEFSAYEYYINEVREICTSC